MVQHLPLMLDRRQRLVDLRLLVGEYMAAGEAGDDPVLDLVEDSLVAESTKKRLPD